MPPKRLLLIDGYSLLFRSFYATRYMSTSDGRPTNALYGFTSMVFSLIGQFQPDCIVVALDAHAKTFRHEEFEAYKGTRKETPPELVEQLLGSRELIEALGIPMIEMPGFEADDVVGTLSKQAEENGYHTVIITGDLDALQLVDHCVTVVTPKQGVSEVSTYDPDAVKARYGFDPEYIPDYKALVGDTSDNIPGVPGIGDKSASKLIQEYGTVENIMAKIGEVEEKFRKKLEPALEQIPKSKWLATIVRQVPLEFNFNPFRIDETHLERAEKLLVQLEFKSHAKRFPVLFARYQEGGAGGIGNAPTEIVAEAIEPDLKGEIRSVAEWQKISFGRKYGIFFAASTAQSSMFDTDESSGRAYLAIGKEVWQAPAALGKEIFLDNPASAIGHDVKSLYKKAELNLTAPGMDTMIAAYVLQSGRSNYTVGDIIQGYLDTAHPGTAEQIAVGLSMVYPVMTDRVKAEDQTRILNDIELPLIPILAEMEGHGIRLSTEFLVDMSHSLEEQIGLSKAKIFELAGQEFLIASPKQLGEVLFEKMEIPGGKKTKTGWATGAEILQEIEHPIAAEVQHFRELSKLKSTYSDSLPRMVAEDGRIHTSFNQTVAATGRLSSNEPNLQNIPIRTELGRQIRKAFIAGEGYSLASLDYSQIELRLLAHLCEDENLVKAFNDRVDVHTVTAALMFNLEQSEVSKEQRRLAKMLNYAVLYGVTDFGLAQQLGAGFDTKAAKALIEQYFERFPTVKKFTESVVETARSKSFTTTLMGRRRYFPDIHNSNRAVRQYAERQAMNAPIQGAASDLVKMAMIDVRKKLGSAQTRMLLQVHDELVFELRDGEDSLLSPVKHLMEEAMPISVPIEVDAKVGENWSEMKPISLA